METWEPARSSNIKRVEYDPLTQTAAVHFQGGGIYDHVGVPPDVFLRWQTAPSAGEFFHRVIKGKFTHSRRPESHDRRSGTGDRDQAREE